MRVAHAGNAVELGAARVAEPEQARALVEGLARGIVERAAEHARLARHRLYIEQQRVAAAGQQAEKRRLERVRLEVEGRDVTLQMVDCSERKPASPGDRLGRGNAHEQRADQPGACA